MIFAAWKGQDKIVEVLVNKGANIEAKDNVRDECGDHIYSVRGERGSRGERWKDGLG